MQQDSGVCSKGIHCFSRPNLPLDSGGSGRKVTCGERPGLSLRSYGISSRIPQVGLGLSLEESAPAFLARGIDHQTHLTYRLRVLPKVTQLVNGRPGI